MSIVFSKDVLGSFPLGSYFTVNIDTDTLIIYRKDVPVWKSK
jgi:hypothetical protein